MAEPISANRSSPIEGSGPQRFGRSAPHQIAADATQMRHATCVPMSARRDFERAGARHDHVDREVRREHRETSAGRRRHALPAAEAAPHGEDVSGDRGGGGGVRARVAGDEEPEQSRRRALGDVGHEHDDAPACAEHLDRVDGARISTPGLAEVDLAAGGEPGDDTGRRDRPQEIADHRREHGKEDVPHELRLRTRCLPSCEREQRPGVQRIRPRMSWSYGTTPATQLDRGLMSTHTEHVRVHPRVPLRT